eukprot:366529-Chlamydomonas_euryale.AAC.5
MAQHRGAGIHTCELPGRFLLLRRRPHANMKSLGVERPGMGDTGPRPLLGAPSPVTATRGRRYAGLLHTGRQFTREVPRHRCWLSAPCRAQATFKTRRDKGPRQGIPGKGGTTAGFLEALVRAQVRKHTSGGGCGPRGLNGGPTSNSGVNTWDAHIRALGDTGTQRQPYQQLGCEGVNTPSVGGMEAPIFCSGRLRATLQRLSLRPPPLARAWRRARRAAGLCSRRCGLVGR